MTVDRVYDCGTHHICRPSELRSELLAESLADDWEDAKLEWTLERAVLEPHWSNCLCGHGINQKCY